MSKPNPQSKLAQRDPFRPPARDVSVGCIHCGGVYRSGDMKWERRFGNLCLWWCPEPSCDGAGYGFDLYPTNDITTH